MLVRMKVLGLLASLCLLGCSGNSSEVKDLPGKGIKIFTGVVNNASVYGITTTAVPIGNHGQLRLNIASDPGLVVRETDDSGRYKIILPDTELSPYIISVTTPTKASIADGTAELVAQSVCQVATGCQVNGGIAFGEHYLLAAELQWSAAVDFVSEGQFIVVNPITEMAGALGYTEYIDDISATTETAGDQATNNYYSQLGIIKGNTQTANLFDLTDILSLEPVNLFSLHLLVEKPSLTLEQSIRYGALIAAWQKLELEHNDGLVAGNLSFQESVIKQYIANQGQFYQAAPSNGDLLSMKLWYSVALENLIAVRDYHKALARSVPAEVDLVITRFTDEIEAFTDGELTTATPTIPANLTEAYFDAVQKTKAMVGYVSDLANNFATEDFRHSYADSQAYMLSEINSLAPQFDGLLAQLLTIYDYYLSCVHSACDSQSTWHALSDYVAAEKKLTITQSEFTQLEVTQGLVFDTANPEGSEATNAHDLFLRGAIEKDGLRFELSDVNGSTAAESISSSIRFSFPQPLAELPLPPELIAGGKGQTNNEGLVPDAIEWVLPSFNLYQPTTVGNENELIISGVFSALMVANVEPSDFIEGTSDQDKLGKRYNLSNVSMTVKIIGAIQGVLATGIELRDNAVITLQAAASAAILSIEGAAAYFPDTVYPTLESFFKSREGFSVGTKSPYDLVVTRRGIMELPVLSDDGFSEDLTDVIAVQYLEIDYEFGGLKRFVVYPKVAGIDTYWGLVCSNILGGEEALDALVAAGSLGYTHTIKDAAGNDVVQSLLSCESGGQFEGEATVDSFMNKIYAIDKNQVSLGELNGQGIYRFDFALATETIKGVEGAEDIEVEVLQPFPQQETSYKGTIEQTIVLGVDSMRLQYQPELVNSAQDAYLAETVLDMSLIWRRHDVIDVDVFLAYDAESLYANPDGSGLPYLAIGANSESYAIAYQTDGAGNEVGDYTLFWSGVTFIDGPLENALSVQKSSDETLREEVAVAIGSNVFYEDLAADSVATEEVCGFFDRGTLTPEGVECNAIAYLTYRGLVTGSIREERDGIYVIRYIDDSWQVLGQ